MNETAGDNQPDPATAQNARNWATVAHLAAFAGLLLPAFGNVIGPLVVWLLKKDDMPLVDDQGKEAVNFQITMTIGFAICVPLILVFIGIPLMYLLFMYNLVFVIVAAIKANEGVRYRYPFALRLIN